MRLQVSQREFATQQLSEDSLAIALGAIREDGYVVLGGVVDPRVLDAIKAKLDLDTIELLRRGNWERTGQFAGHLSQSMPRSREHVHTEIVANPLVIQVTAAILGEGVHNHFYNCNTNMPGSGTQPLHRDAAYIWPDPIHPFTSIIVNISPVDVDESNGATELWPGTHQILGSTRVTMGDEIERRAIKPPVRAVARKGDAVLRDPRQWHRGVPNPSGSVRHMIAMLHSKWFYEPDTTIPVSSGAVDRFTHGVLSTKLEIVSDDYDYLSEVVQTLRY